MVSMLGAWSDHNRGTIGAAQVCRRVIGRFAICVIFSSVNCFIPKGRKTPEHRLAYIERSVFFDAANVATEPAEAP